MFKGRLVHEVVGVHCSLADCTFVLLSRERSPLIRGTVCSFSKHGDNTNECYLRKSAKKMQSSSLVGLLNPLSRVLICFYFPSFNTYSVCFAWLGLSFFIVHVWSLTRCPHSTGINTKQSNWQPSPEIPNLPVVGGNTARPHLLPWIIPLSEEQLAQTKVLFFCPHSGCSCIFRSSLLQSKWKHSEHLPWALMQTLSQC